MGIWASRVKFSDQSLGNGSLEVESSWSGDVLIEELSPAQSSL